MEKAGNRQKRFARAALLALAVVLAAALLWGFAVEPSLITATETEFADARLPAELDGLRAVFFADLHAGSYYSAEDAGRVVDKIKSLDPDILLFGGDLTQREDTALLLDVEKLSDAFAGIRPKLGKYAILGNHDIRTPETRRISREILEGGGFTVLENGAAKVADGFYIAGTAPWPMAGKDDPANRADASAVAWTARDGAFSLLLAHEPAQAEDAAKFPFALQLSGHTHGGQVSFPFVGPLLLPGDNRRYAYGFYRVNETALFVTRGVGTSVVRVRFCAPPEVVVITLRKE